MMTLSHPPVLERNVSNESPANPSASSFHAGQKVRVRAGIVDPENPDLTIGRWCGTVDEIDPSESPPMYLVRWDRRTRDNMHPVFVKRCNRDDLEIDIMWLDQNDLEADDGALLPFEQPGQIVTRALREEDQDDRLRAIFGLTGDDAVPEVDEETLLTYYAHLATHLVFPFEARWTQEEGPLQLRSQSATVLGLLPQDDIDEEDGILCDVKMGEETGVLPLSVIERDENTPQGRLVTDYTYWVHNWGNAADVIPFPGQSPLGEPGFGGPNDMPVMPRPSLPLRKLLNFGGVLGAVYGGTLGAILSTLEAARTGMLVGAIAFAVLFGLAGRRYGLLLGAVNRARRGPLIGGLVGLVAGGILGALLGAMAVAFVGTILGSIVGTTLAGLVAPLGRRGRYKFLGGTLGACAGGIILAVTKDQEPALMGLLIGALIGIVATVFLVLATLFTLAVLMSRRR
jgi:Calcium binding